MSQIPINRTAITVAVGRTWRTGLTRAGMTRAVPGAIVRRTGLGHFGDPDADTVERLTWLTGGAG
jgi:hypothetical protein